MSTPGRPKSQYRREPHRAGLLNRPRCFLLLAFAVPDTHERLESAR